MCAYLVVNITPEINTIEPRRNKKKRQISAWLFWLSIAILHLCLSFFAHMRQHLPVGQPASQSRLRACDCCRDILFFYALFCINLHKMFFIDAITPNGIESNCKIAFSHTHTRSNNLLLLCGIVVHTFEICLKWEIQINWKMAIATTQARWKHWIRVVEVYFICIWIRQSKATLHYTITHMICGAKLSPPRRWQLKCIRVSNDP